MIEAWLAAQATRLAWKALPYIVTAVVLLGAVGGLLLLGAVAGGSTQQQEQCPGPPSGGAEAGDVVSVGAGYAKFGTDAEARRNATIIIARGIRAGVGERGVIIALMTAGQETGGRLHNLGWGDADSEGLFQQRPAAGWGTPAQVRDPVLASDAFYGVAAHTNNPGLTDIAGWEQMSLNDAAQRVQVSAFPTAYAKWEPAARALVSQLWSAATSNPAASGTVTVSTPSAAPAAGEAAGAVPAGGGCPAVDAAAPASGAAASVPVSGNWANPHGGQPYRLSSPFGMRLHPILRVWKMHEGQDFGGLGIGVPIYAACTGVIVSTHTTPGEGNATVLNCGGGVQISVKHQPRHEVKVGQQVKAGQRIGSVGNTGNSTGPHAHFEVRVGAKTTKPYAGTPVDPVPFMAERGVKL